MINNYVDAYLKKHTENYELYEFLSSNKVFENWQITAIFYSALCYVKAYLYSKGISKNSINSHDSIKSWLTKEQDAKQTQVFCFYEKLYFDSRDARYSVKKISQARINQAVENYKKVKELLKIK